MSDGNETQDNAQDTSERGVLMQRARLMGIEFSNNIGTDTLKERIREKMASTPAEPAQAPKPLEAPKTEAPTPPVETVVVETPQPAQPTPAPAPAQAPASEPEVKAEPDVAKDEEQEPVTKKEKVKSLRQHLKETQMKLVRLRITNMDPKKADLPGEILTVANEYLGTVRVFVPFGEATDDGWHVPYCIYKMMEKRKFLQIRTIKDKRTGVNRPETNWVREFALEVLPPLTQDDLNKLANAQAAAGSVG